MICCTAKRKLRFTAMIMIDVLTTQRTQEAGKIIDENLTERIEEFQDQLKD